MSIVIKHYIKFFLPFFHLMLSQFTFAVSGFLFWWTAARLYSTQEIGMGSVFISLSSILSFFSSLGIISTFIRFIPEDEKQKDLIYSLFIFSFFLLCIFYLGFLLWVNPYFLKIEILRNPSYAVFLLIFILAMQIFQNLDGLFIASKATDFVLRKNIFQSFFKIGILFLLIPWGGFGIFGANGIAALFAIFIYLLLFTKKFPDFKLKFHFNLLTLKNVLSFSSVNFLNAFSSFLPGAIFPLIIFYFFSNSDVGFFYIPWMCFSVWCSLLSSIMNVFLMKASHGEQLRDLIPKVATLSFFVATIGFIIFYFFGNKILILFGRDFLVHSLLILKILFLSLYFFLINQFCLTLINIRRNIKEFAVLSSIITGTMSIFIFLFIFKEKGIGVAKGWLISNLAGNIYILFRFFPNILMFRNFKV